MRTVKRIDALAQQLRPSTSSTSLIGLPVSKLDTPSLFVDLDALEANIHAFAAECKKHGAIWRPHMKAIRVPALALKMIEAGAVGVTCAKVSQAAVLVDAGVRDVLVANEVVGATKVQALVELTKRADRVSVACDDASNLHEISAAAEKAGVTVGVMVDVDAGMRRCGIPWHEQDAIVALAKLALSVPGVEFRGMMAYDGHAQALEDKVELTTAVGENIFAVQAALDAAGVKVPLWSGAGSGNFYIAAQMGSISEVQAGGGVLSCNMYADFNAHALAPPAQTALFLQVRQPLAASHRHPSSFVVPRHPTDRNFNGYHVALWLHDSHFDLHY
jgi:D-serine deaminase-like pyridoxal phosphate-dependent protein